MGLKNCSFVRNHGKEKKRCIANSKITQRLLRKHVYLCHMRRKANKKTVKHSSRPPDLSLKKKREKRKGILEFPPVYGI